MSYRHTIILLVAGTIQLSCSTIRICNSQCTIPDDIRVSPLEKLKVGFSTWILKVGVLLLLLINTILSAYWKTPFSLKHLSLFLLNSTELWMKNTELYGLEKFSN